jgi:hypothetical protein
MVPVAKRSLVVYGRFSFGKGFVGVCEQPPRLLLAQDSCSPKTLARPRLLLARAGNRGGEGQAPIPYPADRFRCDSHEGSREMLVV